MKKVLLVSYYWPPAGGVSVLRTLKIAKYLREFGYEPVVYTTSNASFPYLDPGNLADVPDNAVVIRKPILEPFNLFKKLSGRKKTERLDNILQVRSENANFLEGFGLWIRANFFIPDARALWIKPSVRHLKTYLKENPVDVVFSDGPPHTNTVIANKISQYFKLPWLADFQDPWTQADYYEMFPVSKIAHRIHSRMEQSVFRNADKITIASPTWAKDLESIGAKNVDVVYYGYDEDDFRDLPEIKPEKITITHAGLLGIDRFPENFFRALAEINRKQPDLANKLQVVLAGQVDFKVREQLSHYELDNLLVYKDFIPRRDVLEMNLNANLLLLPLNKAANARGRLPGKLYEYLRCHTPVLAFGPEDSDAAEILKQTGCGQTITYQDKQGVQTVLEDLLRSATIAKFHPDREKISAYSNREQTRKVAAFLDQITKKND